MNTDSNASAAVEPDVESQLELINSLQTRIGLGSLSNAVWNTRNRYLSPNCHHFTPGEMQMIVEGFLTELATTNDRIAELENQVATGRERIDALINAWGKSWDCSRDPGHQIMNAAINGTEAK